MVGFGQDFLATATRRGRKAFTATHAHSKTFAQTHTHTLTPAQRWEDFPWPTTAKPLPGHIQMAGPILLESLVKRTSLERFAV